MNFVSLRLITADVRRLVGFYEQLTGLAAAWLTDEFAELATPSCTLAIGSERTMALYGAGAARGGANQSAILEFRVDDLDRAAAELSAVVTDVVQEPTTQPWGNRSWLFRDPDGNLINLFARLSPA